MLKLALLGLGVLTGATAYSQTFEPTYPCVEFAADSSCAKFPYLRPQPEVEIPGVKVRCDLVTKQFQSTSTQTVMEQQDCIYGQCKPAGYGLVWFLTRRVLSNKDAPRVIISTKNFTTDESALEVVISYHAAPAFFDSLNDSSDAKSLNAENNQLNSQMLTTTLKGLREGVTKNVRVGVLGQDASTQYVDGLLSCSAK